MLQLEKKITYLGDLQQGLHGLQEFTNSIMCYQYKLTN